MISSDSQSNSPSPPLKSQSSSSEQIYSDDFSEEPPQVQTVPEAPILIQPSQEINVIMTFEPKSSFLNHIQSSSKKPAKKGKIKDKPVTFHKKIKSSGYGSQPKPAKRGKNLLAKTEAYIIPTSPPSLEDKSLPVHNGPIFNINFDRSGSRLATSGGDSAAYILKLPISKYKGERIPLVGHEWQVNSITWDSECNNLLTTSNNYCSKLWNASKAKPGECLLTIPGSYTDGKFYYVDRFILLLNSNDLCFFRYKLRDPFLKDDVKRLQAKCLFKETLRLKQVSAQSLTRSACHNNFASHIILAAGSNKIVSVWDIDKQVEVCQIPTAHRKMIHTMRFFSCSDFADVDNESVNLFWTCSADNYLRLFDLRIATEPVLLLGHMNTALELGASVSPCKQFIASGSEDRSAYVWDIRTQQVLQRLKGFKDVTNDVAWNPAFQQICVAGNEGKLKFFN